MTSRWTVFAPSQGSWNLLPRTDKPSMGRVRSFVEHDIPYIAELYGRVFGGGKGPATQRLRSYFAEMLLRNPWYDEALPSLVYEDHKGEIVGFLGVMPRPMSIDGRPVQMAISHTF